MGFSSRLLGILQGHACCECCGFHVGVRVFYGVKGVLVRASYNFSLGADAWG